MVSSLLPWKLLPLLLRCLHTVRLPRYGSLYLMGWLRDWIDELGSVLSICVRDPPSRSETCETCIRQEHSWFLSVGYRFLGFPADVREVFEDVGSKSVPPHVNILYCFGGLVFTSFIAQVTTGAAIMNSVLWSYRVFATFRPSWRS